MIVRAAVLLVAAACVAWAVLVGPPAAGARATGELGKQVAAGNNFRPEVLQAVLDSPPQRLAGTDCYVADLRGRMLIATRMAELALNDGDMQLLPRRLGMARDLARRLLACEPYDSQAWLALYWSSGHLDGFGGRVFDFLAMSYRTGPLEGWIAFRRNPQAASVLGELSDTTRMQVINEWQHLVLVWQFVPAASALQRATGPYREQLLNERQRIPEAAWIGFARFLERIDSPLALPDVPDLRRR